MYTHVYNFVHMCINIYTFIKTHMCIYVYPFIHTCSHINTHICLIYINTYTHTHTYVRTLTYTHTYNHTYKQNIKTYTYIIFTCAHTLVYNCMPAVLYVCSCTYAHIYMYITYLY